MRGSYLRKWQVTSDIITDSGDVILAGTNVLIQEGSGQSLIYNVFGGRIGHINCYPYDFLDKKAFSRAE
jgi:hypothetical protein